MRVALFVTCLVDTLRPQAGFATVQLLEQAGCQVNIPEQQTCCGQPAYNNGDQQNAHILARQAIELLREFEYVVVPSGSCAGMMIKHYPALFKDDEEWFTASQQLSQKTYELTQFLVDVLNFKPSASCPFNLTYHDACSSRRELGVIHQPRQLLGSLENISIKDLQDNEICCGFGGTFCVKYPEISTAMVTDKANSIINSQAQIVTATDMGCLLNIAGRLKQLGSEVKAYHIAEVLAGMTDQPAIAEDKSV